MGKFIKSLIAIITLLTIGAMLLIMFFASRPTELPEVDGREDVQVGKKGDRDVLNDLSRAFENQGTVVFSEADLNKYLARVIEGSQTGQGSNYVKFKGIWVNLKKDTIECFVERELTWTKKNEKGEEQAFRQDHITQLNISVKTEIKPSKEIVKEFDYTFGKIGSMKIHGQFIRLAKLPFENLYQTLDKEMKVFHDMNEIYVRDGEIELSNKAQVVQVTADGQVR